PLDLSLVYRLSFNVVTISFSTRRSSDLDWVDRMVADGLDVKAQVASRPIGVLLGLQASANPFLLCPSYGEVAQQERVGGGLQARSEEHTSELQSRENLVCRLLLEKKKVK